VITRVAICEISADAEFQGPRAIDVSFSSLRFVGLFPFLFFFLLIQGFGVHSEVHVSVCEG